jgi:hypothetical protein
MRRIANFHGSYRIDLFVRDREGKMLACEGLAIPLWVSRAAMASRFWTELRPAFHAKRREYAT